MDPGGLPYKKDGGARRTILVPLWVFRLKISTVGAIAAPFWVLCREKYLILFHRFVYITMNNRTEIYDNAFKFYE